MSYNMVRVKFFVIRHGRFYIEIQDPLHGKEKSIDIPFVISGFQVLKVHPYKHTIIHT